MTVSRAAGFRGLVREWLSKRRRGHLLVLRTELRRGPGWLGVLVFVAGVLGLDVDVSAHWRISLSELEFAAELASAAAAGIACRQGSAEPRANTRWLSRTSVRQRFSVVMLPMMSGVLWTLAGFTLLVLVACSGIVPEEPQDPVSFSPLIWCAAQIVATGTCGFVLGRALPMRAAPLLLPAVWVFLVPMFLPAVGFTWGWPLRFEPFSRPSSGRFTYWSVNGPCLDATHYLLAAAVALLLCARYWRRAAALAVALTVSYRFTPDALEAAHRALAT